MKIFDISIPISPAMVVWPGDPLVALTKLSAIENGENVNLSQISMSVHTGTHIDAPRHFLKDGKTIEQIPIEKLVGKVLVMEFNDQIKVIDQQALETHPKVNALSTCKKALFKTTNSLQLEMTQGEFSEDYVGIDKSGALFLAKLDLDLIGIDYLSIANFNETEEPHQILLRNKVILLEGIDLKEVHPGFYDIYCLPLPIVGSDGAPARTILIEQDNRWEAR